MSLYVETIPCRKDRPIILLRKSIRKNGKIQRQTLANLSLLPSSIVEAIRSALKEHKAVADPSEVFAVRRALPHGNVCAALGVSKQIGLPGILHRQASRKRDLALAAIVARLLHPVSEQATALHLSPETATSSLGVVLGLGSVSGSQIFAMHDWLLKRQPAIEQSLANRHLGESALVLYDVSPSDVKGLCSFRLMCAGDGCPVAVEVFVDGTEDPPSLASQAGRIWDRFPLQQVSLIGDGGMLSIRRSCKDRQPAVLERLLALRSTDIRKLLGTLGEKIEKLLPDRHLSLSPPVAEITSPDFPNERMMVFFDPVLREVQACKRERLLHEAEAILKEQAEKIHRRGSRIRGRDRIKRRIERLPKRYKVEKYFDITIGDDTLVWSPKKARIAEEARLDGLYTLSNRGLYWRSSGGVFRFLTPDRTRPTTKPSPLVLKAYKSLFRSLQNYFKIRPINVRSSDRIRAHIFLCMLVYYLEWHMRKRLAPMLFHASNLECANMQVGMAEQRKREMVYSLRVLLSYLADLTWKDAVVPGQPNHSFPFIAEPTPLQTEVFEYLRIKPRALIPVRKHP